MSAAKIDSVGVVKLLDGRAEPEENITEQDVQEPKKLARLLGGLLRSVAQLRRSWAPRRIDFENLTTAAGPTTIRLQHNFNGRVRWWLVDYEISGGAAAPIIQTDSTNTDANTLVLLTYTAGRTTVRVEEAG